MKLADAMRIYRTTNRLTQEELAKKVGVTRQTVATWENDGAVTKRNLETVLSIIDKENELTLTVER